MSRTLFEIAGFDASTQCHGCDKPDSPCVLVQTEAYCLPMCGKCVFREARNREQGRKDNPPTDAPLFSGMK